MKLAFRDTFVPICIAALISILLGLTAIDSFAAGEETKRVFVLNSFNRGYTWTDNMLRGIDDAFSSSGIKVETYVTFMDMKRIPPTPQYFSKLKELIKDGFREVRFDAILACDNDALEFMRKHRDELFPKVPVVFSSINDFEERMLDGRKDITGTSENTDYEGTIRVALKLRPATKNIVVVIDNTTTGKAHRSAVEKIQPKFQESVGFTYLSLADMTLDELTERLSKLNKDSIVLLLQHFVDKNGTTYTVQQSTPLLTQRASVPVFVSADIRVGLGALGGHVVSGYHHGEAAAQMVAKILKGSDVGSIPVLLDSPNKYMFDYGVMQRFNISEGDLPQGSILVNEPVSLLHQYRQYLFAIVFVFIVLCGILIYLIFEMKRRKKIEQIIRNSEKRHASVLQTAMDGFWRVDIQGRLLEVNQTYCQMSGYNEQELLSMKIPDLEAIETEVDTAAHNQKIMTQGQDRFESRHRRKDGTIFDVEVSAQYQPTDGGQVVGFLRDISQRKQADEKLRKSEDRFRSIFERSTVAKSLTTPDGKLEQVNQAFADMLGYTIEEMSRINFAEITHPDDLSKSKECIRVLLANEQTTYRMEKRYIHKSGAIVCVDLSSTLLRDDHGTPMHLITSIVDITQRKWAEEALLESEAKLKSYIESAGDAIYILEVDTGRILDCNSRACLDLGYSRNELLELSSTDIESKLSSGEVESIHYDLNQGEVRTIEGMHKRKDGSVFPVEIHLSLLSSVQSRLMIAIARDITERKRAIEIVQKSEEKFNKAFHSNPVLTAISTIEDGRFLDVNEIFLQALSFSREEVIGKTSIELGLFANPAQRQAARTMTEEKGYARNIEARMVAKNGRIIDGLFSAEPITLNNEKCWLTVMVDVTEQKRVEEEKRNLEGSLQQSQKMESVGRLAGGVAHDFNNMLGVILGHTEIALDQVDSSHPLHANLHEIRKAAERSSDLTSQLLAFARKQVVAPKVLDLNDTVAGMLKMLLRLIGEDINLAWLPGADLWPVEIDPSQIDQILANLSVNARDAIAGVGRITIETENISFDKTYCDDHPGFVAGEYALLTVSDDGSGMDKETIDNIFEPFFTTKGIGKGTGLGLATVYGIVKQNSGFINVYSEPNEGTTFRIYLPRHIVQAEQIHKEVTPAPIQRGKETILLVEDEPSLLDLSKIILESQGYLVLAAGSPNEAIHLAKEHAGEIHLLMTDVVMPEMNGRDLAKHLQALNPHLRCLFTSGYTANVIAHHGVLDKGVHFIQKPFSRRDLAAKMREVLDH